MVGRRPEITGEELAGFGVGDGGTAVAGLMRYLLLADLGGLAQRGQVATQGPFEGDQFRRFQVHRSFTSTVLSGSAEG